MRDRGDEGHPCRRAAGEDLDCLGEHLLDRDAPLLDRDPVVPGDLQHRQAGDPRQDRVFEGGCDQGAASEQEEEVAGRALFDVAVLAGVEEDRLHVALAFGLHPGQGAGHVVGRTLDPAGSAGVGPHPRGGDRPGGPGLEVRAHGGGDDHDPGVGAQVHADAPFGVRERADVHGVAGNETVGFPGRIVDRCEADSLVPAGNSPHRRQEHLFGIGGHVETLHRGGHAPGVALGAEELERTVALGKGLEPLEAAQAVLGGVVDQGQLGKGVAPGQELPPPLSRQGRLFGRAQVLFLDVLLAPSLVFFVAGQVDPRVDLQGEAFGHDVRSSDG